MSQNTITLKLTTAQEAQLFDAFSDTQAKRPPYAKWQLRPENCVITCYESGKTVFQGKDAQVYAGAFMKDVPNTKKVEPLYPQAGSDEVGTGDYFGPVCVCATIVTEADLPLLQKLGVRDSKQLSDADIMKIAPQLMKQLHYSLLILDNERYNLVHKTTNMNAIKAKLHNQAYVNLSRKVNLPKFIVIDQFTPERSYYGYLKQEPYVIPHIHFETKAEDKYLAVGAASLIARYAFLVKMEEMEKKWAMSFHKGAGSNVDACARAFVQKYGMDALSKVAKLHFANTKKI